MTLTCESCGQRQGVVLIVLPDGAAVLCEVCYADGRDLFLITGGAA